MARCGYSIMKCTRAEWDAWLETLRPTDPQTGDPVTDWPEHAQLAAALQRGVAAPDVGADDVVYHCGVLDTDRRAQLPVSVLSEGRLRARHVALPDVAMKRRVYDAAVYRARDGRVNLRTRCETAVAGQLEARVPATGRTSAQPADSVGARAVLEEARRRATAPEGETAEAVRIMVRMADVLDGDVVEEDAVPRVRFAGERD